MYISIIIIVLTKFMRSDYVNMYCQYVISLKYKYILVFVEIWQSIQFVFMLQINSKPPEKSFNFSLQKNENNYNAQQSKTQTVR